MRNYIRLLLFSLANLWADSDWKSILGLNNSDRKVNDYECIFMDRILLLTESLQGGRHVTRWELSYENAGNHWSRCCVRSCSISLDPLAMRISHHLASLWEQWAPASQDGHHWSWLSETFIPSLLPSFQASNFTNHLCRICCHTLAFQSLIIHYPLYSPWDSPFSFAPRSGCPLPTGHHAWRVLPVPITLAAQMDMRQLYNSSGFQQ